MKSPQKKRKTKNDMAREMLKKGKNVKKNLRKWVGNTLFL